MLVIGCDREESIVTYRAPKDPPPATAPVRTAGTPGNAAPSGAALSWTVPAGWKQLPAREMRFATFSVNENPPVELTVIPLGTESGDLLSNVNRWEGQLGLGPSPKDALDNVVKHQDINGLHVDVVDLSSPEAASPRQRMLAAIIPHAGRMWFFKMTGPHEVVSAQKTNFDAYINSLKPGDAGAPTQTAGAGQPAAPAAPAAPPAGHFTLKTYKAPQGWRELPNQKPPRAAAFEIGPPDQKAELVVTFFAQNNTGSFLDNINRWRNQLGLAPVNDPKEAQMEDITVGADGPGMLVQFHNPDTKKRMLVAIASTGEDLWFFKLTGPDELVTKERTNFDAFMKSVEFGS
jgi:hypothetical protein